MEGMTLDMAIMLVEAERQANESFLLDQSDENDEPVERTTAEIVRANQIVVKELRRLRSAYDCEHSTELVDEAFARRVAVEVNQGRYYLDQNNRDCWLYVFATGAVSLRVDCDGVSVHLADPTQGQFWTAVRLFNVQVKESGEPGER